MLHFGSGKARARVRLGHYPHCSVQAARKKAQLLIGRHQEQAIGITVLLDEVPFLEAYAEKNKLPMSRTNTPASGTIQRSLTPRYA
jgi:hypothetical protein